MKEINFGKRIENDFMLFNDAVNEFNTQFAKNAELYSSVYIYTDSTKVDSVLECITLGTDELNVDLKEFNGAFEDEINAMLNTYDCVDTLLIDVDQSLGIFGCIIVDPNHSRMLFSGLQVERDLIIIPIKE